VMAEPFGVPAGRVASDVPGVIPGGPRPLPAAEPETADAKGAQDAQADGEAEEAASEGEAEERQSTAVPIGEGEEVIELSDEEREAVPTRSDDQNT